MNRRIFIDDHYENSYAQKGYAVIPFIQQAEIEELKNLYSQFYQTLPSGFFASQYDHSPIAKETIYNEILRICGPALGKWFYETDPFIASFLVKKASSKSEVSPHLDWTFVDEQKYSSATIWCPLVDCTEQNGTLEVLEGSHKFLFTLRGSPILPNPYNGYNLYPYMKVVNVKAGEAVVYNHNLIHGSKDNLSGNDRIAIGIGIKPREADLIHIHKTPDGKLKKYRASPSFFHALEYGSAPDEKYFAEEISFNFPVINETQLMQLTGVTPLPEGAPSKANKSFLHKWIQKIFQS